MNKIYIKSLGITSIIILIYTAVMILFVSPKIEKYTISLEEQAGKSKLSELMTLVSSTVKELESFKENSIDIHKKELKNIVSIALVDIKKLYSQSQSNQIKLRLLKNREDFMQMLYRTYNELSKTHTKEELESIFTQIISNYKHDDGLGYFWIDNFKSRMISQIGSKEKRIFFLKMVEAATNGGDFIESKWLNPKTKNMEEKISYISVFEPFDWLIGSGYYVSDVKNEYQQKAINYIESLRYGDNEYLYISDYKSTLIAHPSLRDKDFSTVKDKKGNLIVPPMVDIARKKGEGYHSYWWNRLGDEKTIYEKLTYSVDFKEWSWVIGTGLYLVEVEKEAKRKKIELIEKLKGIIYSTKVSKSGYIFIFDSQGNMIIHPNSDIEGTNFSKLKNPGKKTNLFDDLVASYKNGSKVLSYKWDKPTDSKNYSHEKITWIDYNKDFDWYICSSAYIEDLTFTSKKMKQYILIISVILFLIAFIISLYFFKKLLKPIEILSKNAKKVKDGDFAIRSHIKGDDEIGILGATFDEMLDTIEKYIYSLDEIVKEKTSKITTLLDNAGQGFLTFGADLLVDAEYSKEFKIIFDKDISNQKISHLLLSDDKKDDRNIFEKIVFDLLDKNIPAKKKRVFMNLAAKEFVVNGKYIQVSYKILDSDKIMLILSDITKQKELESKISDEKLRLRLIVSIVKNVSEFKEMVSDYDKFCKELDILQDKKITADTLTHIYRAIHTFKGNFAQKDLIHIVPKLHKFESLLNDFVKNPDKDINTLIVILKENNLKSWLDEDMKILQSILGDDFLTTKDLFEVDSETIKKLEEKVETLLKYDKKQREVTYEDVLDSIHHLKDVKLVDLLSSYPKMTELLAKRLSKDIYPVNILGEIELKVSEKFKPFTKTLVHVFRNSIDHGIESIDERMAKGKDVKGSINCMLSCDDKNNIEISIIDDGRGIDINAVKEKAVQKRMYFQEDLDEMNKQEIYMLLFSDDFSTKEKVSDISGRGVGLASVKEQCELLGGSIEVKSQVGKGSVFKFIIPGCML